MQSDNTSKKYGDSRPKRFLNRFLRRYGWARRLSGERGATMLEWVLLLGVVALPSYFIILLGLETLVAHYRLVTTINGLPLP
ncbi:MAG: hypothetical protein AAGH99_02350 [Planctomycetota bacterium]